MAQFRATVKGKGSEASRLGTKQSEIKASVNGWKLGVDVNGFMNHAGGDVFEIVITGGSSGNGLRHVIGYVELDENGIPQFEKIEWGETANKVY